MSLLDRLQTLPRGLLFLIGVGLGVALYFNYASSITTKENEITKIKSDLKTAEEAIAQAKKVASDKEKFQEENRKITQLLQAAVEFLPTKLNEQDVLAKISNESRLSGVNQISLQPKPPVAKEFYEEVQMDVELEGSYSQLVLFLSYISKIQRIVNIRGLELKFKEFADEVPILRLKGMLVAYRYVEKPADEPAKPTAGAKGAPGKPGAAPIKPAAGAKPK